MFLKKFFDSNERQLQKLQPILNEVNALEDKFSNFSESEIKSKTNQWKKDLSNLPYEEHSAYLNKILPEAFALVREAAKRTVEMRPYDVQILAGIVLHQGKIAEQKTGEGKTLTATLPLYLNSLTGRGAHLVTPNDYLSRHGAGWMGKLYTYLGITVGAVIQERAFVYDLEYEGSEFQDEYTVHLKEVSRADAYKCDITYGTNHEFGFDYLRDNMSRSLDRLVQTNPNGEFGIHTFAIVDEVDSILIDVARTPLIISTSAQQPTDRYHDASKVVKNLIKDTDYEVEEKFRSSSLTDLGIRKVEKMLGISNLYEQDFEMVHLIEQALTAHTLYEKDKDYIVKNDQVIIVDQFTGRLLPSNRYSQGLHQAIEAKENVTIQQESRTIAEISYQNYFRLYGKLAGMTGTAITEAEEFYKIYGLDVVVMPTNKPVKRTDHNDVIYKTESAKFRAVAEEIVERHKKGQPVLVGTTSVEKSQMLHELLKRRGVSHEILNAKNHEREAMIISQAGKKGSVTVSTNMAGRGVDIILGGDPSTAEEQSEVKKLGGLHVIGTERHDSRRIDNQLRGRSGRQGDPGSSRFYVSLQDDLMRIFGGAQVESLMNRFGLEENVPLEAKIVSRAIENAQKKVEGFNFDARKRVVEEDDVINTHRSVIYKLRRKILEGMAGSEEFTDWFLDQLDKYADTEIEFEDNWEKFENKIGVKNWLQVVGQLSLPVIDTLWMEHLVDMDYLKDGSKLKGYAQRDPIVEYKREGHERFEILVRKIYSIIAERISNIKDTEEANARESTELTEERNLSYKRGNLESGVAQETAETKLANRVAPVTSSKDKVGRNDPCPCGSGLKYKKCGMINAPEHKG
ncbi:MAG: preprotein translocase subunit SecA [Patescibacteria group bacterium]